MYANENGTQVWQDVEFVRLDQNDRTIFARRAYCVGVWNFDVRQCVLFVCVVCRPEPQQGD